MEKIKLLNSNELLKLDNCQKEKYYEILKEYSQALEIKKKSQTMKKLSISLCPLFNGVHIEMRGVENIPQNDSAIFICNHSNSHDMFTVQQVFKLLGRDVTVLVGQDCLSYLSYTAFYFLDATFINRRDKESAELGTFKMAHKILKGQDGVIFGEGTWNIHPTKPMHHLKMGGVKLGAITSKVIIPTIFEYVESPGIITKEANLYKKIIVTFGTPININHHEGLITQTAEIESIMVQMRRQNWSSLNISKENLATIDQEEYLNHTYLKKFAAFGFNYDSLYESQFLLSLDDKPVENEYHLNSNNEFVPGVTLKRKK